jgi:outer membrane lipoprotein-sorting protein
VTVQVVIVLTRKDSFPHEMNGMRIWLDDKRITPASFECEHQSDGEIAIKVTFRDAGEADAFAKHFVHGR